MAKNQYPRRRVTSKSDNYGITSKPFNSKPSRTDGRDEYITIFVEDDLKPQRKEDKDNE